MLDVWFGKDIKLVTEAVRKAQRDGYEAAGGENPEYLQGYNDAIDAIQSAVGIQEKPDGGDTRLTTR